MFSHQATLFHLLFTYDLSPASLGVFYIFLAYFFAITALFMSFNDALIKTYYKIHLIIFTFIVLGTITSGIFLTFTGAIDAITDNGIGVLIVGIIFSPILLVVYFTYSKWKSFMLEYYEEEDNEEIDEEEEEEKNENDI
jgi:hypothetical protein